jgi:hypothetical protein
VTGAWKNVDLIQAIRVRRRRTVNPAAIIGVL